MYAHPNNTAIKKKTVTNNRNHGRTIDLKTCVVEDHACLTNVVLECSPEQRKSPFLRKDLLL